MYINKVVFVEFEDVEQLKKYDLIHHTDYDTTEIIGSELHEKLVDLIENPSDYDYKREDYEQDLRDSLGADLYEMLLDGRVDFCLVCP
jgi:hypothetical protein